MPASENEPHTAPPIVDTVILNLLRISVFATGIELFHLGDYGLILLRKHLELASLTKSSLLLPLLIEQLRALPQTNISVETVHDYLVFHALLLTQCVESLYFGIRHEKLLREFLTNLLTGRNARSTEEVWSPSNSRPFVSSSLYWSITVFGWIRPPTIGK